MNRPTSDSLLHRVLPELEEVYNQVQKARIQNRLKKEMEGFRTRFGGAYRWAWHNDHFPAICFSKSDFPVTTTIWPQGKDCERLNAQFSFTNPMAGSLTLAFPLLRICSPSLLTRGAPDPRLRRIHLNDTILDASFICHAQLQEDYAVRSLLTGPVKKMIFDLYYMTSYHSLSLALVGDRLVLKKQYLRDDFTETRLGDTVENCLRILEKLTTALRVEVVDPALSEMIQVIIIEKGASCRVCGEPILLDMVSCKSCETPHHRDCWEYAGNCAMYGCGEQAYMEGGPGQSNEPMRM